MIDICTYRLRIGCYNPSKQSKFKSGRSKHDCTDIDRSLGQSYGDLLFFIYMYIYIYLTCMMFCVCEYILLSVRSSDSDYECESLYGGCPRILPNYRGWYLPSTSNVHVDLLYLCLISFIVKRFMSRNMNNKGGNMCNFSPAKIFFADKTTNVRQIFSTILLFILTITFLMIAIINPNIKNPGPGNLSIFYQNVQGLIPVSNLGMDNPILNRSKIFELNTHLTTEKPDIVVLNETWLVKSIKNREIIEGNMYNVFRCDRSQSSHPSDPDDPRKFRKSGGGVLIAIRSDIEAASKKIKLSGGAEIVAIQTTINGLKYIFCTCYRVGTLGAANQDCIRTSIAEFFKTKKPKQIFIIGDFNLSTINWPLDDNTPIVNPIDKLFVDSFNDFGLTQCITCPTHSKGKTLDILLTNQDSLVTNLKILEQDSVIKSDHFPIKFEIKAKTKKKKPSKRKIYNFKRANWDALNRDLCGVNWNAILDCTEPELAWNSFKSTLFCLVDKHIPTISIKSEFQPPWFDSESYQACMAKEKARKKFKRTNSDLDELNFKHLRREFKKISSQKMRDNMFNTDDPALITKKFWSHIKYTSNSRRLPEQMYCGGCFRKNPKDKANLFNNFFYEQFSESSTYNIHVDYTNDENFNIDFCHRKIRKILSQVNSNKSCGPDLIQGKILKNCAVGIAYPLSLLFKLSYNTGSIPSEWKRAHVVPIHKKGAKENVENYRPISLTSLIMKTFERIIKDELLSRTGHLLDERQHGFLNNKSCTTNMVGFCDSLALSMNEGYHTDVVYFDFSKAFDSVNHDLILKKLKYSYNIDGRLLKFLANYLSEREQCVVIGNSKSDTKPVLSGVPQGSIIGPILFVLFINDLAEGLSSNTDLALYADDTKIWRTIHSELDNEILQKDIDYLNNWATLNKMKFHPQKCKVISVASRPPPLLGILPNIQYFYSLGENLLDYADCERDLGIDINSKLNFSDHCERVLSKAKQQLGIVRRTCYFVNDIKRRRSLYLSLVRSKFEHCTPIWRPTGKTMLHRFESLQKFSIKWILSEEYISYNSNIMYIQKCRQVNLLPIRIHFTLNDLVLFHKIVYEFIPVKFPSYLSFFNGITRLRSSHLDNLSIVSNLQSSRFNETYLRKSFFFRTHTEWNALPNEIRQITSPSSFKEAVKKHFWNNILNDVGESDTDDFDVIDNG